MTEPQRTPRGYSTYAGPPRTASIRGGLLSAFRASYRASQDRLGCLPPIAVLFVLGLALAVFYEVLVGVVSAVLGVPPIVYLAVAGVAVLVGGLIALNAWRSPSRDA